MTNLKPARELVLKLLFQIEVGRLPVDEVLEIAFEELDPDPETRVFAERTVRGVLAEADELDRIIGGMAEGWRLDRLAKVDKTVLRVALHELRQSDLPPGQIISDAVDIAKRYSTEDSGRFVNGILGNYNRTYGRAATANPESRAVQAASDPSDATATEPAEAGAGR